MGYIELEGFWSGEGGKAGYEGSCWAPALFGRLPAVFKTQRHSFTFGATSLGAGNYLSPHHTKLCCSFSQS